MSKQNIMYLFWLVLILVFLKPANRTTGITKPNFQKILEILLKTIFLTMLNLLYFTETMSAWSLYNYLCALFLSTHGMLFLLFYANLSNLSFEMLQDH